MKIANPIAYAVYPLTLGLALGLHFVLLHYRCALLWSTYIPVALAAVCIHCLELRYPYRKQWRADSTDLRNDATFMLVVQVLLPKLLAWAVAWAGAVAVAVTLLDEFAARASAAPRYWPHHWHVVWQGALMLLVADFFRYWLHRSLHQVAWLWPFHAPHHSPRKLYWMNTARFHPFDKAAQYLLDTLPFVLLGVAPTVLALYFVFYAVNGFFQHCNINLRLGYLNYIISGPELHRWHHSKRAQESNQNYGNNLIVWDWLFGTRFLPSNRQVATLGLINPNYPQAFIPQLVAPFIKKLDKRLE